jgi:thiol:disulfide interchange protein
MKKILLICLTIFCFANGLFSQILNPVKWSFESKKISDTEFDLVATAKLDKGWYIYTQHLTGDDGPIPTKFTFKTTPQFQLVGDKPNEVSEHKKAGFDKVFQMNVTKFSEMVQFVQRVKLVGTSASVQGSVEYGTCDDEKCLPPQDANFTFNLTGGAGSSRGAVPTPPPATTPAQTPTAIPTPPQPKNGVANNTPVGDKSPSKNAGQLFEVNPVVKKNGILKPVKWAFQSKKINETEYDLTFNATIDKGWHIYSQNMKGDGPQATSFTFDKSDNLALVGKTSEQSPKRSQHKEPLFDDILVIDFAESATFIQRIKVKDAQKPIKGVLEFMACDDRQCLPSEEIAFNFNLATGQAVEQDDTSIASLPPTVPQNDTSTTTSSVKIQPSSFVFDKTDENITCDTEGVKQEDKSSLWWIFLLGFGGGLIALLTPCVFPMIPLTVSFFTKSSKDRKTGLRNAWLYALSIIILYVSMGLLITAVFGSDALNRIATNPWMNLAFGLLFLVFAISFFGYFEITLPSSWTNKADEASNKGGLVGIFFMAFTLALVSFSCTGPIIGTLLVQTASTSGISLGPAVGMFGFALALALPFGLFAAFPAWLQSLPKSGSWMDDVKVTLGFIEVALAFKFLSNTDLIKGWKFLPYEAFLAIWILCALGLAAYHAGLFNFKYNRKKINWTTPRMAFVGLSLVSAIYLGFGFRYNPISETFHTPEMASGILPPAGYSYIYPQECPLNINCFHDLNEGIAHAKKVNKPILLDFTGWNCANCRKMEENVWNKPGVFELIRDKYVLISLYTDDKHELKAPYTAYTSKFDGKLKDTEGEMWTDLEGTFFNKNSQPFYVLISSKENDLKVLNAPVAYTPEIDKYKDFLQCGLDRFNSPKPISMNEQKKKEE